MNLAHFDGGADDGQEISRAAAAAFSAPAPASARLLTRMLDIVDYGVMLVRADGRVGFANRSARTDLRHGTLLQLDGSMLRARDKADALALTAALEGALKRGVQRLLSMGKGSGQSLAVAVLPLGDGGALDGIGGIGSAGDIGGEEPSAIVLLGKSAVCVDLSADEFARRHGVTSAELRVMKQLTAGFPAVEIARTQGVALSTVRTQISSLRDKTGAGSIVALIRQVATLPPLANRALTTV